MAPNVVTAVIGGLVSGLGAAALVLATPVLLGGSDATTQYSRANAVSSAAGVLAPATLGAVDLTGVTGRTALLLPVIPLALLAQSARSGTADRTAAAVLDHVAATRVGAGAVGLGRRWAAIVLGVAMEFCFVVWGVGRLRETGISAGAAAILASAFPIGLVVGRVAAPGLIRRGRPPIIVGALVTAVATVTLVAVNSPGRGNRRVGRGGTRRRSVLSRPPGRSDGPRRCRSSAGGVTRHARLGHRHPHRAGRARVAR